MRSHPDRSTLTPGRRPLRWVAAATATAVVAVLGAALPAAAVTPLGTVIAWGDNVDGQSTVPSGLSGVTAIAAGELYSLALTGDGGVVAWGLTASGRPMCRRG